MLSVPEIEEKLKPQFQVCKHCGEVVPLSHGASQRSEISCTEWMECVIQSVARTASYCAKLANETSGTEHMILGEICDALRILLDELRTHTEKHSIEKAHPPLNP